MRARRHLLVLLLAVLIPSAKSSADRIATPRGSMHDWHRTHVMPSGHNAFAQMPGIAQTPAAFERAARATTVIDGAENPEMIPDDVAYRHFIRATASSATSMDVERRTVFLREAGLSPSDTQAYSLALGNVANELKSVEERRKAAGTAQSSASLANFKQLEDQAIVAARTRVEGALSAEGRAKLATHLRQNIKRRIKMFSSPMTK